METCRPEIFMVSTTSAVVTSSTSANSSEKVHAHISVQVQRTSWKFYSESQPDLRVGEQCVIALPTLEEWIALSTKLRRI